MKQLVPVSYQLNIMATLFGNVQTILMGDILGTCFIQLRSILIEQYLK